MHAFHVTSVLVITLASHCASISLISTRSEKRKNIFHHDVIFGYNSLKRSQIVPQSLPNTKEMLAPEVAQQNGEILENQLIDDTIFSEINNYTYIKNCSIVLGKSSKISASILFEKCIFSLGGSINLRGDATFISCEFNSTSSNPMFTSNYMKNAFFQKCRFSCGNTMAFNSYMGGALFDHCTFTTNEEIRTKSIITAKTIVIFACLFDNIPISNGSAKVEIDVTSNGIISDTIFNFTGATSEGHYYLRGRSDKIDLSDCCFSGKKENWYSGVVPAIETRMVPIEECENVILTSAMDYRIRRRNQLILEYYDPTLTAPDLPNP